MLESKCAAIHYTLGRLTFRQRAGQRHKPLRVLDLDARDGARIARCD
jgi:hypothetical protein